MNDPFYTARPAISPFSWSSVLWSSLTSSPARWPPSAPPISARGRTRSSPPSRLTGT